LIFVILAKTLEKT